MDGAQRGGTGTGGGASDPGPGRERQGGEQCQSQQQLQQQWPTRPSSNTAYLSTATPAPVTLPGIAVFLHHQQVPLARRFQSPEHHRQQQQLSGPVTQQVYSIYNHAYDGERISEQAHVSQSTLINNNQAESNSGSPNLSEFRNIALSRAAPSSSRSSISSSTSSNGSGGGAAARTQTNYKSRAMNTSRVTMGAVVSGGSIKTNSSPSLVLPSRPIRTSRYLREVDRRNILERIENGEKQANLAKEYQVSRAAISNLKQRRKSRKGEEQQQQHDHSESGGHDDSGDQDEEDGEVKEEEDDKDGSTYRQLRQEAPQQQQQLMTERMRIFDTRTAAFSVTHESNLSEHHRRQSLSEYELKRHTYSTRHSYDSVSDHKVIALRSPYRLPLRAPQMQPPPQPRYLEPAHDDSMETLLERVTEVATSSMEVLFARLVDQRTDAHLFQTALSRVARLLLEHALSLFPIRGVRIPIAQSSTATTYFAGTEPTRPTCALAMSECGGGPVLLREYQTMEPSSGIGFITLPSSVGGECDVQMPRNLLESNVVLVVELRGPMSCQSVAKALRQSLMLTNNYDFVTLLVEQAVLRCGVQQQDLVLVALCSHEKALGRILKSFAKLRIVTCKIFTQDDPSAETLAQALHSQLVIQEQQQGEPNSNSNNFQRLRRQ